MANYSDVPEINALYLEQAQIASAITMLDQGGTISSFTVSPDPAQTGMAMATAISTVTVTQELIDAVHASLVARYDQLTQDLGNLGVTGTPSSPAAMQERQSAPLDARGARPSTSPLTRR